MANAGRLRDRVVFTRLNAEAVDAYGQPHTSFEALFTRWGDMRETTGKESIAAGAITSVSTGTLRIRYSTQAASITAADRVEIRGAYWNIHSIIQVDRKANLIEMLIERGFDGSETVQSSTFTSDFTADFA